MLRPVFATGSSKVNSTEILLRKRVWKTRCSTDERRGHSGCLQTVG